MITELRNELSKESASQRHAAEKCRATAAVLMSVSADDPEDVEVPEANRELLPRADHLLLAAKDLLSRCSKSIQSTDQNCSRLRQRAELLLERRLLETEKSAKLLREHASEVDYTIAVAARSLEKSEKRCSGKENLAKAAKLDSTRNALRHLRETRQAMKLQMQNKLKMQTIDASCRKVTSQSASSPSLSSLSRPLSAGRSVRQDEMEQVRSLPRLDCDGTAQTAEKRMRPQSAATYKARGPLLEAELSVDWLTALSNNVKQTTPHLQLYQAFRILQTPNSMGLKRPCAGDVGDWHRCSSAKCQNCNTT
eukprot:symbB.v1.2.030536.t1/scaffold3448.1/size58880/2